MEAVALYTFRATEGDELSFNKGDLLKVKKRLFYFVLCIYLFLCTHVLFPACVSHIIHTSSLSLPLM